MLTRELLVVCIGSNLGLKLVGNTPKALTDFSQLTM